MSTTARLNFFIKIFISSDFSFLLCSDLMSGHSAVAVTSWRVSTSAMLNISVISQRAGVVDHKIIPSPMMTVTKKIFLIRSITKVGRNAKGLATI